MSNITITCLGHGGAFAHPDVGNTSYLIDCDDHRILVDCGSTVPDVLKEFNVDPGSLTAVLISHLHMDHVGGLERLLYHRHYVCKSDPLRVIACEGVMSAWLTWIGTVKNDLLRHMRPISGGFPLLSGDIGVEILPVNHGGDIPEMACSSFQVHVGSRKLFFSGDRIWEHEGAAAILNAMRQSDLAFHELELFSPPSGAHTNVADLQRFYRTDRVWWGHHGRSERPAPEAPHLNLAQKGDKWVLDPQIGVTYYYPNPKCS